MFSIDRPVDHRETSLGAKLQGIQPTRLPSSFAPQQKGDPIARPEKEASILGDVNEEGLVVIGEEHQRRRRDQQLLSGRN